MTRKPMDVWLKMSDDPEEDLAEYEANTYRDGDGFVIEWYHNDVGLVTSVYCNTYTAVTNWYLDNGYEDFTVYDVPEDWDEATPAELEESSKAEAEFIKAQREAKKTQGGVINSPTWPDGCPMTVNELPTGAAYKGHLDCKNK